MRNFGTLYIYELKKICIQKIVWITMGVLVIMAISMGVGEPLTSTKSITTGEETVTMGGFEYLAYEKENAKMLNGQKIDDAMLKEVKTAYQRMHMISSETVEDILEMRKQYSTIYLYIYNVMGSYDIFYNINEDILYQTRLDNLWYNWTEQGLSEDEQAYWEEKENKIVKPFTYSYESGWEKILEEFLTLNFMLVLAIAICLSNIFPHEHVRKTDQLILCSRYGKIILFYSKIAAGVTFGVVCGAVLLFFAILSILCVYGMEGARVAVQIYLPICSWNLTMGQAVLLMSTVYIIAGIFYSVITMFLSMVWRSSIAVMGFMTGSMIVTIFLNIPYRFRLISQIYELLPTVLLRAGQLQDGRLAKFFGVYLANFHIAPIIYIVASVVLVFWGNKIYRNYQV